MAITINNPLTSTEYADVRFDLIKQLEGGNTPTPYFDTEGNYSPLTNKK